MEEIGIKTGKTPDKNIILSVKNYCKHITLLGPLKIILFKNPQTAIKHLTQNWLTKVRKRFADFEKIWALMNQKCRETTN